jgi:hypothetical protein
MEQEDSFPYSYEPATCPCREPDESSSHHTVFCVVTSYSVVILDEIAAGIRNEF